MAHRTEQVTLADHAHQAFAAVQHCGCSDLVRVEHLGGIRERDALMHHHGRLVHQVGDGERVGHVSSLVSRGRESERWRSALDGSESYRTATVVLSAVPTVSETPLATYAPGTTQMSARALSPSSSV